MLSSFRWACLLYTSRQDDPPGRRQRPSRDGALPFELHLLHEWRCHCARRRQAPAVIPRLAYAVPAWAACGKLPVRAFCCQKGVENRGSHCETAPMWQHTTRSTLGRERKTRATNRRACLAASFRLWLLLCGIARLSIASPPHVRCGKMEPQRPVAS